jgi:chromosome partitioning protein
MAHIIVVGNEKGGSGKTTTAMHLIISLMKLGFTVGTIDLDSRQQSLTRYIENRKAYASKNGPTFEAPEHYALKRSEKRNLEEAEKEDEDLFLSTVQKLNSKDFIVIDTPGSDAFMGKTAHSYADTVITPINDSFVDLDLIGNVNADTLDSMRPGIYSAMLWEQKMKRATRNQKEINWFVVRNRLSSLDAINKRNVETAIQKLSKRFGFKTAPGFGDRVIFKELFLHGLTLHDARDAKEIRMSTSVIAARMELREFIKALGIQSLLERINSTTEERVDAANIIQDPEEVAA